MIKQVSFIICTLSVLAISCRGKWQPKGNILPTPWSETVSPADVLPAYPRPQLQRDQWLNLNGLWQYTLESVDFKPVQGLIKQSTMTTGSIPQKWTGNILVPYAIDAPLSGVHQVLRPTERLWYQKRFTIPDDWQGKEILLHFQAADWETSVYINGKKVGQHRGGYDPFSFNITTFLKKGENKINVCTWDATAQQAQAIGKQILPENRKGFRYQPTGGIWKTVWIEPVPKNHVTFIKITPDIDNRKLHLKVNLSGDQARPFTAEVLDRKKVVALVKGTTAQTMDIPIPNPRLWSPKDPFLYGLKISLDGTKGSTDNIRSYFGMRKVEIKRAPDGFIRTFLNNKPVFQFGPLDQGYWPDGVLTPPSDDAERYDLEYLKKIGCNMVRVHIKTHTDHWYYLADSLGLLVWQDMVCMPKYGQTIDSAAARQWQKEFGNIIHWLYNHPGITQWIVFNEGWGQHRTTYYTHWVKKMDPTRIVTDATGWTDKGVGDVLDVHDYSFYPRLPVTDIAGKGKRERVIGETGGLNLTIPGHTWYSEKHAPKDSTNTLLFSYKAPTHFSFVNEGGRQNYPDISHYKKGYAQLINSIRFLEYGSGCAGVVYTQITDVEHELNGWLTYDRKVSKINPDTLMHINRRLFMPAYLDTILPFHLIRPPGKNIAHWEQRFILDSIPKEIAVALKGFDDGKIWINGKLFKITKLRTGQEGAAINYYPFLKSELSLLKKGTNIITADIKPGKHHKYSSIGIFQLIRRAPNTGAD